MLQGVLGQALGCDDFDDPDSHTPRCAVRSRSE
jgi:hypothetical protein